MLLKYIVPHHVCEKALQVCEFSSAKDTQIKIICIHFLICTIIQGVCVYVCVDYDFEWCICYSKH